MSNEVTIFIEGKDRTGPAAASAKANMRSVGDESDRHTKRVSTSWESMVGKIGNSKLLGVLSPVPNKFALIGAGAVAAVPGIVSFAQSITSLAPAALVLPAALGAAALGMSTFKLATSGFGDAVTKGGADLAKLAPEARKTAEAVRGLQPAWAGLKADVQSTMFKDLSGEVKALGSTYLPILKDSMHGVAAGFNLTAKEVSGFLKTPAAVNDVSASMGNLKAGVNLATGAVLPLSRAFVDVFAVGSTYMPRLGAAITGVAQNFAGFIARARDSGQLTAWIDKAIQGFKDWGAILGNVGSILHGVFAGANSGGETFSARLRGITDRWKEFINSAEGQGKMQKFWEGVHEIAGKVGEVFRALGPMLGPLIGIASVLLPAFSPLLSIIVALAGPLTTILTWLNNTKGIWGPIATGIGLVALAFKGFSIIEGLAAKLFGVAAATQAVGVAGGSAGGGIGGFAGKLGDLKSKIAGVVTSLGGLSAILKAGFVVAGIDLGARLFTGRGIKEHLDSAFAGMKEVLAGKAQGLREALGPIFGQSLSGAIADGVAKAQVQSQGTLAPNVDWSKYINGGKDAVGQVVTFANGQKGTITLDGNPDPATGKTRGVVAFADGSRGTISIDGNQTPVNGKVTAAVTYANGSRGTIQVDANTSRANAGIDFAARTRYGQIVMSEVIVRAGVSAGLKRESGGVIGSQWAGPRRAGGGGGGAMTLVGEAGPELVDLPYGSRVRPAGATRNMLEGGQRGGGGVAVSFVGDLDGALATVFMRMHREGKIRFQRNG